MPATIEYTYPSSRKLFVVEQEVIPNLTQDDPIFDIFPISNEDTYLLEWEQEGNFVGMQQSRGLNSPPPVVANPGVRRYMTTPNAYGEYMLIDEMMATAAKGPGDNWGPVDLTKQVYRRQEQLLYRRLVRMKYNGWSMASYGILNIFGPNQTLMYQESYGFQTFYAGTTWDNTSTAGPLKDFRAAKLLARGNSVDLGAKATAYLNQTTANYYFENTNPLDIAGKRTSGLSSMMSLSDINALNQKEGLPQLVIHDDTYLDENGIARLYIPDGKIIIVGKRPSNASIGNYVITRNANAPGMRPIPYMYTKENRAPFSLEVHDGHNGGLVVKHPGAIVIMEVL